MLFAAVTDTHTDVISPQPTTRPGQVDAALAVRGPDSVLHCGDITDTGLPDEYDQYDQIMPDPLPGRPGPYAFDVGGVQFIGFDPCHMLQEHRVALVSG